MSRNRTHGFAYLLRLFNGPEAYFILVSGRLELAFSRAASSPPCCLRSMRQEDFLNTDGHVLFITSLSSTQTFSHFGGLVSPLFCVYGLFLYRCRLVPAGCKGRLRLILLDWGREIQQELRNESRCLRVTCGCWWAQHLACYKEII